MRFEFKGSTRAERRRAERKRKKLAFQSIKTQTDNLISLHWFYGRKCQDNNRAPKRDEFKKMALEIATPELVERYLEVPKVKQLLEA